MRYRSARVAVILVVVGLAIVSVVLARANQGSPDHTQSQEAGSATEVRTSGFIMSVEAPERIRAGEAFALKGTLEYIGEGEIRLDSQIPTIRFFMFDGHGEYVTNDFFGEPRLYTALAEILLLRPGQKITVEDMWRIDHPGEYELIARTDRVATGPIEIIVVDTQEEAEVTTPM
jgi:hypothetical protein